MRNSRTYFANMQKELNEMFVGEELKKSAWVKEKHFHPSYETTKLGVPLILEAKDGLA